MQNYIFFHAWINRGKLKGLHSEFGKCAFLGIEEISEHYFFTNEEKIEFLLRVQDHLKLIDEA